MYEHSSKSLLLLTAISSGWGLAAALLMPFFALYIEKFGGGVEKVGLSYALIKEFLDACIGV